MILLKKHHLSLTADLRPAVLLIIPVVTSTALRHYRADLRPAGQPESDWLFETPQ